MTDTKVALDEVESGKNSTVEDKKEATQTEAVDMEQAGPQAAPPARESPLRRRRVWITALIVLLAIIIVVVVVVPIVVMRDDEDEEPDVPVTVNYETGVSLVTDYGVNATISSRLAQTKITMDVVNTLDCSSIHSITLQLPLDTRVVSLQTISDTGCTTHGEVGKLQDVRETFLETAAQGLPGAYIEEQDSFTYSLQVAIPPLGETRVELVLEALLQQRLGEVEFQLPLIPNEQVDHLLLDLTVEDVASQLLPTNFSLDFGGSPRHTVNATSPYHLNLPDAREHALPRVLHGQYHPGEIPDNGVLYTDGTCFEHFFQPASLEPMKRNLVFVLDTSGSMEDDDKLEAAKIALRSFIDTLTPNDTFAIQTFSRDGTEKLWGSALAIDEEKADAKRFVQRLQPQHWRTNLHEAILHGMVRAREAADDSGDDTVTVLMLISDGRATHGERDRPKIAEDVYKLNRDGKVKVFSLGFQGNADMNLLNAIAIMNGGVAAPLVYGYVPYQSQIKTFFESRFGAVLLFDVSFETSLSVYGVTQGTFPVLSAGYEIVVRGLLHQEPSQEDQLRVVATGSTIEGILEWGSTALQYPTTAASQAKNSRCFQSYAHSRIAQLLRYRDVAKLVPQEILAEVVNLAENCTAPDTLADCIEKEALSLALEGNIVAKGLTGMSTVDDEGCLPSLEGEETEVEICRDGTTEDGYYDRWDDYGYEGGGYVGAAEYDDGDVYITASYSCRANLPNVMFTIVLCLWFVLNMLF